MKLKSALLLIVPLLLSALATPVSARVPSERILFASFADQKSTGLRSIRPTGEGRRTLTEGNHRYPRWSPDRTQIAFEKESGIDGATLFVMNKDGSGVRELAQYNRSEYYGVFDWSPDGTKIVYAAGASYDSPHDIYVVDVSSGESTLLTDQPGDHYHPAWSPDGTKIAYASEAAPSGPDDLQRPEIAVMDADGSNKVLLTDHWASDYSPEWSPDGSLISFITERHRNYSSEIYVMDATGENERRVTEQSVWKDEYEWSPDGTRFAYLGRCDNDICDDRETDVYVINLDGTGRRNITNDARFESSNEIEWSPNGRWVAYAWTQRGGRSHDLMIAKADGSRRIKQVTDTPRRSEVDFDW